MSLAPDPGTRIPPTTLPKRLQDAREWRGYTQDQLADVLDVSRATISNYERGIGQKGISKLQINAWAAFCDVDVDWLKTGSATPDESPDGGGSSVTGVYRFPGREKTDRSSVARAAQSRAAA